MNGKFLAPINVMKAQEVLRNHTSFATVIADQQSGEIKMSVFDYVASNGDYTSSYIVDVNSAKELNDLVDVVKSGERVVFIDGVDPKNMDGFSDEYQAAFNELFQRDKLYGIEFSRVVAEFLQSKGQVLEEEDESLEAISDFYSQTSPQTLINNREVMQAIEQLDPNNQADLYKRFPFITDEMLGQTVNDYQARKKNREDRLSTVDKRLAYMGEALQEIGREYNVLQTRESVAMNKEYTNYAESLSEEGKQKYRESGMSNKIQILLRNGAVDPERCKDGTDSYHRLMSAMTNPNSGNYLVVTHVATTGVSKEDMPIQFYAAAFKRDENGIIDFESAPETYMCNIKISKRLLMDKEAQLGKFDPFKYTGIDLKAYKEQDDYSITPEKAIANIHNFFAKHDGCVVTLGDRYAQSQLMKIGSLPNLNNAESIDIISTCMYYAYIMECEDRVKENVIFGEKYNGRFSLQDLAKENDFPPFTNTEDRCAFALQICVSTFAQYIKDHKERFPAAYEKVVKMEAEYSDDATPVEKKAEKSEPKQERPVENKTLGGLQFAEANDDVLGEQPSQTVTTPVRATAQTMSSTPVKAAPEPAVEEKKPTSEPAAAPKPVNTGARVPRRRDVTSEVKQEEPLNTPPLNNEATPFQRRNAFSNANSQEQKTLPTERPKPEHPERRETVPPSTREQMPTSSPRFTSPRNAQPERGYSAPPRDNEGMAELFKTIAQQNEMMQRMMEEQSRQNAQFLTALTTIANSFTTGLQTMQKAIEAQQPTQEVQQAMLSTLKAMQENQTVFSETLLDQERTNSRNLRKVKE